MKKKNLPAKQVSTSWFPISVIIFALIVGFISFLILVSAGDPNTPSQQSASKLSGSINENLLDGNTVQPTVVPTPTPIPYPPAGYHCTTVPILMYHHVQPLKEAQAQGHAGLTVDNGVFAQQLQYLKSQGYTGITLTSLGNFFDGTEVLPKKPVILTFDDGYDDFYHHALPILEANGFVSDLFVPTGLLENPGYMTWEQVRIASTRGVQIGHHSWSHANVARFDEAFFIRELDVPLTQLSEHGHGRVKVFAYPYGTNNKRAVQELAKRGFTIAVTTAPGRIQCREDRLLLRRIRIGNSSLRSYGL